MRSIPGIQKTAAFGKTKFLGIFVLTVILVLAGFSLSTRADTLDLSTPDHLQHEIDKLSATIGQFENRMHSEGEPLPDPSKATAGEKLAKDAGKLFKKAEIAFLAGRDQLAIKEFKTFLFSHPGNELGAVAQIRLAQLYLERGNSDLARTHLLEARWLHRQRPVATKTSLDPVEVRRDTQTRRSRGEASRLTSDGIPEVSKNAVRLQNAIDQFATDVGDRIFFDSDSSDLSPASQKVLRNQAQWLNKFPNIAMTLVGHSDERGTRAYNLALGARRAEKVRAFLIDAGVDAKRIRTLSYGKERPVALCNDAKCWVQNRRVVTRLNLPETAIAGQSLPSDNQESETRLKSGKKIQI